MPLNYSWNEKPYSGSESQDPYTHLRLGRIIKINNNRDNLKADPEKLGTVEIEWLDWGGIYEGPIQIAYSSFANPIVDPNINNYPSSIGSSYGFLHMPSVGDVAVCGFRQDRGPIILGYLPFNYNKQTETNTNKASSWGTFRILSSGEYSLKSKQQAEMYLDKIGNIHLIVKEQTSLGSTTSELEDGSTVPLDTTTPPTTELAHITVGTVYDSDDWKSTTVPQPVLSKNGINIYCRIKLSNNATIDLDAEGNIDLTAANGKTISINKDAQGITKIGDIVTVSESDDNCSIELSNGAVINLNSSGKISITPASGEEVNLNSGTKGVARLDDTTTSSSTEDSTFWTWLVTTLVNTFNSHTHSSPAGGSTGTPSVTLSNAPSSLSGKINSSSTNVKAGD